MRFRHNGNPTVGIYRVFEKYVTYFTQPLDHRHPKKGSFRQRVIVAHAGFDRPTVIITEGYGAAYALKPQYREELSRLLNANMVFVEYRYFLESTPNQRLAIPFAESSADDLHAVTTAFKTYIPENGLLPVSAKADRPPCSTAHSIRTMWMYPFLTWLPSATEQRTAVTNRSSKVSTDEDRKRITDFQLEVLKRKAAFTPLFEKYCTEQEYKFRAPIEEIYDYSVLEYSFALWQWGTPVGSIPATHSHRRRTHSPPAGHQRPVPFHNRQYQRLFRTGRTQLGYYGYDTRPFKKYLSIKSGKGYLHRLMLPEELKDMPFDKTLSRKIKGILAKNDPK